MKRLARCLKRVIVYCATWLAKQLWWLVRHAFPWALWQLIKLAARIALVLLTMSPVLLASFLFAMFFQGQISIEEFESAQMKISFGLIGAVTWELVRRGVISFARELFKIKPG